jgi:hypothetical protein
MVFGVPNAALPFTSVTDSLLARRPQRIHVGLAHAGRALTLEAADTIRPIYDDNGVCHLGRPHHCQPHHPIQGPQD